MPAPLSAVVITLNAASQLEACLASVAFAEEILVVDSGSTDGTVELAQARGARVIQHEWLGYGRQKHFAVTQAAHDWVLCIDADERVSDTLRRSIVPSVLPESTTRISWANAMLARQASSWRAALSVITTADRGAGTRGFSFEFSGFRPAF